MRAIISVYDKSGIVEFARGLRELGYEIVSTGGTETLLRESGIHVRGVDEVTGFPEILGGRVKTLHPMIHGGILARRDEPTHTRELEQHAIQPVDLVVSNLYPFLETVRASGANLSAALENIDIGGHTLLRAAAKNFQHVIVVCRPSDYPLVLQEMRQPGGIGQDGRRRLAARALQYCASYDTHVAAYLRPHDEMFPSEYTLALTKVAEFQSGENPHQLAALYAESSARPRPRGLVTATQLHGIPKSYNNTLDADLAWRAASDFTSPCVAIVKHGTPVGLSLGVTIADAYRKALGTDPQTAFGSAVAANQVLDEDAAREVAAVFFEDLVAPGYTREALALLRAKPAMRVFATHPEPGQHGSNGSSASHGELEYQRIGGGFLVQTPDGLPEQSFTPRVVTRRPPTLGELTSLYFAWRAVKHADSHATMVVRGQSVVGVGAGQPSRQDAVDLACRKAGERTQGAVLASDGFFPFVGAIERAAEVGITALIQPGGSQRDADLIREADRRGLAMIFTGERHYRH